MVLGMSLPLFTTIHVTISLIAIVSGFIVLFGFFSSKPMNGMTALFLLTTILTSVTGFMYPFHGVTPGIIVGVLSLIVLLGAVVARYGMLLAGKARWVYVVCATIALYFNFFVLVAQSFMKIPALHNLAPNGNEPPFLIVQVLVLVFFAVAGYLGVKKFHPFPGSVAKI